MKITIEHTLSAEIIDRFYDLYQVACVPVRSLAATRHTLDAEDFTAQMRDPRIDKYIAWSAGTPVGLTTITNDLSGLPWIEPTFYLTRHPELAAQGKLFYLGYILVDPDTEPAGTHNALAAAVLQRVGAARGILAFDMSARMAEGENGSTITTSPRAFGAPDEAIEPQAHDMAAFQA